MTTDTVFYSWQNDLPGATNRGFIEQALQRAINEIHKDTSVQVEPALDRDTVGIPGSPDIADTIFEKIANAQIFVADVSIIGITPITNSDPQKNRPTPNPNVVMELGYAVKSLGWSRILLVMNTAFSGPEMLPFDLRKRHVITYDMPKEVPERAPERRVLEKKLGEELRKVFASLESERRAAVTLKQLLVDQTIAMLESGQAGQERQIQQYMQHLVQQLDELRPEFSDAIPTDDSLVEAFPRTINLVTDFARVTDTIAAMNLAEAAGAVYRGFEAILQKYNLGKRGVGMGGVFLGQFDFYKFLGHELFVTFFSSLIRQQRWRLIADLLEELWYLDNPPFSIGERGMVSFEYVSDEVVLLSHRKERMQGNRVSIHADILYERHTQGKLGTLVPIDQLTEADYFLFLRAVLRHGEERDIVGWNAWSCVYLERRAPRFLIEASQKKYAEQLLRPLGVTDLETLRSRLAERATRVAGIFGPGSRVNPVAYLDIQGIGRQ